jgi:hypothetical protein
MSGVGRSVLDAAKTKYRNLPQPLKAQNRIEVAGIARDRFLNVFRERK